MQDLVAQVSRTIRAPVAEAWEALTDPEAIRQYLFGTAVETDWKEGSPIVWKGQWQGRAYEDRGVLLRVDPGRQLRYSHFSPMSGLPDLPENYHTVTVELSAEGGGTRVTLTQDHNATEGARAHSEENWSRMLEALGKYLEG